MKGLAETRRQLLASYPSCLDVTLDEHADAVRRWAEEARVKLEALSPPGIDREKVTPQKARSLTAAQMKTIEAMVLRCTDLRQLKQLRAMLYQHTTPLIMYVRGSAYAKKKGTRR